MCRLKESDQSRATPRLCTWGLEEMVVLPIMSGTVGGAVMRAGGKMISSFLDMLSICVCVIYICVFILLDC